MTHKSEDRQRERAMRFATWNLKYPGREQAQRRVDFLKRWTWDVIALQEVSRNAWDAVVKSGIAESSYYTSPGRDRLCRALSCSKRLRGGRRLTGSRGRPAAQPARGRD